MKDDLKGEVQCTQRDTERERQRKRTCVCVRKGEDLGGCMCTYLPIYVCLDVCVCVSRYVSKLRLLSSVTLQKNHFYELKYSNVLERVILKPSTYLLDGQNNMAKTPSSGHRYDFVEICVRWHKINFMYVHCLQTAIAMVSFALFV